MIKPSSSKVSVITPIFKVEHHIARCANSLFSQSFDDIEYIFVDDGSPDKSLEVLNEVLLNYPHRLSHVKIIIHEKNQGVSTARNTGLKAATGKYILFVDSDDWIEKNMIQKLHFHAEKNGFEMVWTDFYFHNSSGAEYRRQVVPKEPESAIKEILIGRLHAGLWNKLFKREICIVNELKFPENVNIHEDIAFIAAFLLRINSINYLPKAYYHYEENAYSLTKSVDIHYFESAFHLINFLESNLPDSYNKYISYYKARIKRRMFISGMFSNIDYFNKYPESNPYIYIDLSPLKKFSVWLSLRRRFKLAYLILRIAQRRQLMSLITAK